VSEWQTRSSRLVYENPWISVREDAITAPGGHDGIYGVVTVRNDAVFVVPMTEQDEVLLVRQYRYTIGRESLEVPAGGCDGEDPERAAARELLEETGYRATSLTRLGEVFSLNGVSDAPGHVFLARGLTRVTDGPQFVEEGIAEVVAVPWAELLGMVARSEIHDGETLAALLKAAVALGRL
jgi:8-oxo-dGTP pyrophosphatase MutT (NUDIX family)